MEHFNVTFKPDSKQISIHAGATLIEAAAQAAIILNTSCGGKGLCGKCLVKLQANGQQVLACQYRIQNDLTVIIPPASKFFEYKILQHGIDKQIKVNPTVCKKYLKIHSPSCKKLQTALNEAGSNRLYQVSTNVTHQLSRLDAKTLSKGFTVTCHLDPNFNKSDTALHKYIAVCLEQGDTTDKIFGLAIDIGTTTVVAKLIDMTNGRLKATQAAFNPQSQFGDDVISRITYAQTDENLTQMHEVIVNCLNELIARLCRTVHVDAKYIYEAAIVGNTTMNHIFLKFPLRQLGQAPYKAFSIDAHDLPAENIKLQINSFGNVHTVENIAGFVGSDTTAVALAVDMDSAEELTLVVDIGTNGEVVLGTKDKLYAASCAAGPALEGARITHGSCAVEGAIEAIVLNKNNIDLDIIGNCPPRSICGSGLIDAVAILLDLGIVDSTGRFIDPRQLQCSLPPSIFSRILGIDGQLAFCLADTENADRPKIFLTQKDIRQVQLAKAAIRTGIKLLQKQFGVKDSDIRCILLAGAFGNYIRRESALRIGLLPKVPIERIHFVGNAASSGAQMILLSRQLRAQAGKLARMIRYVEIAHEPQFTDIYAECMAFS